LETYEGEEVYIVGKDFWDYLGGNNAYEDLIKIYEAVGEEIRTVLEQKFKDLEKNYIK